MMLMDPELGRKRRRTVVTHFELIWKDCKAEKTLSPEIWTGFEPVPTRL